MTIVATNTYDRQLHAFEEYLPHHSTVRACDHIAHQE